MHDTPRRSTGSASPRQHGVGGALPVVIVIVTLLALGALFRSSSAFPAPGSPAPTIRLHAGF